MKFLTRFLFFGASFLFVFLVACDKDDDPAPEATPPVVEQKTKDITFKINHVWGADEVPFAMETYYTHAGTNDELKFNTYRYYISNIQLTDAQGNHWAEEESYHLITLIGDFNEVQLNIENVPLGSYTGISYMIGVDSLRNTSGVQTRALDPANGMFWSWITGYIFVKAEGETPNTNSGVFSYHIGGFAGEFNAIKVNTHTFNGATLVVDEDEEHTPRVEMVQRVDHLWFDNVPVAQREAFHSPAPQVVQLANNFSRGFRFDHVH